MKKARKSTEAWKRVVASVGAVVAIGVVADVYAAQSMVNNGQNCYGCLNISPPEVCGPENYDHHHHCNTCQLADCYYSGNPPHFMPGCRNDPTCFEG